MRCQLFSVASTLALISLLLLPTRGHGAAALEETSEAGLRDDDKGRKAAEEAAKAAWERDAPALGFTGVPVMIRTAEDLGRQEKGVRELARIQKRPLRTIADVMKRASQAKTTLERMYFVQLASDYPIRTPKDFREIVEGLRRMEDEGKSGSPDVVGVALEVQKSLEVALTSAPMTPEIMAEISRLFDEETGRRSALSRWLPLVSMFRSHDESAVLVRRAALVALIKVAMKHDLQSAIPAIRRLKGTWDGDLSELGKLALGELGDDQELDALIPKIEAAEFRPEITRFGVEGAKRLLRRHGEPGVTEKQRKEIALSFPGAHSRAVVDFYCKALRDRSTPSDVAQGMAQRLCESSRIRLKPEDLRAMLEHPDAHVRNAGFGPLLRMDQNHEPIPDVLIPILVAMAESDDYDLNRELARKILAYARGSK